VHEKPGLEGLREYQRGKEKRERQGKDLTGGRRELRHLRGDLSTFNQQEDPTPAQKLRHDCHI
jgi:hypothetical protein